VSLVDLQDEVNRMFDRMWHTGISTAPLDGQQWAPVLDLVDEPSRFVLTAEVPGLNVEDIEVCYEDGQLVLKGAKPAGYGEGERPDFLRRERRFGNFRRCIPIPEAINVEALRAKCQHGVLEVVMPKKEPASRKTVRIEVSE
jgi:HSP20 family protein